MAWLCHVGGDAFSQAEGRISSEAKQPGKTNCVTAKLEKNKCLKNCIENLKGEYMKEREKRIKEKFSDMMELPKELLLDIPRMTVLGNEDVLIENYKGIVEYDENVIRLNNRINILGEKLNVEEITDSEIMITGVISNIEFEH